MGPMNLNFAPLIVIFGFICAGCGWVVIEFFIWLFSHVTINF